MTKCTIDCRLCGDAHSAYIFSAQSKFGELRYFDCPNCGYVQVADLSWLDQAYSDPINHSDTGILQRNAQNAVLTISTLAALGIKNGSVADFAGGYGILVRLLRDYGVNAFWSDIHCVNLMARGFELNNDDIDLITAFECFEHFVDPYAKLMEMLSKCGNILISTELIADKPPDPSTWWYYGLDHGQHIGFFRKKTLQFMAAQSGADLFSDHRSVHLFTTSQKSHLSLRWRFFRSLYSRYPRFLRRSLVSKTWSDHLSIARNKI